MDISCFMAGVGLQILTAWYLLQTAVLFAVLGTNLYKGGAIIRILTVIHFLLLASAHFVVMDILLSKAGARVQVLSAQFLMVVSALHAMRDISFMMAGAILWMVIFELIFSLALKLISNTVKHLLRVVVIFAFQDICLPKDFAILKIRIV